MPALARGSRLNGDGVGMGRWLDYARLVRLPNVFTAMADIGLGFLATYNIAEKGKEERFPLLLFSSAALYLGGMVWNDYFDINQDKKERPFRPLASGRVSLSTGFRLGAVLLLVGVLLAGLADWTRPEGGWPSLVIALVLAGAILLYDGWFKRTFLGPVAMGSCRFLNVLLGLSVISGTPAAWGWWLALVIGVYITGVTWFARTEARESSVPMLKSAAGVMLGGVILSLGIPALVRESFPGQTISPLFLYLLVFFVFIVGMPVVRAIIRPRPEWVQPAVKRAVLGLVLLDAILATALIGWVGMSLVILLVPASIVGKWVYST
jgi:4-hydroxybenzoate polyprenyltransferase